jgi:ESS family glutamate:Na+ symporter
MSLEIIENLPTLRMGLVSTLAVAALLLVCGDRMRKMVPFFTKFCIPSPVIGGFSFALLAWLLKGTNLLNFDFDTTLQTSLMIAFFTTIGLGGSLSLIKRGGKSLLIYLVGCWILAIMQNVIGTGIASITGIHPVLGVMAGAVSLEGGHGAASAFGPTAEQMGIHGAFVVAIASATYGLIAGSLLGGPTAKWLIDRHHLKIKTNEEEYLSTQKAMVTGTDSLSKAVTSNSIVGTLAFILVIMVLGEILTDYIESATGFILPGYISAMLMAVIFRNLNDCTKFIKIDSKSVDLIADVSLGLFLSMAMMSLRIWELAALALPLILILAVQTAFIFTYCTFVIFPALGRDYDAAVMCAGMMGHGLGATPNALANMDAVCERYGVISHKAFLIVPLCGAVLIDMVGIPSIVWFINYFV